MEIRYDGGGSEGERSFSLRGSASDFETMASQIRAVALGEETRVDGEHWSCRYGSDPVRLRVSPKGSLDMLGGIKLLSVVAWFDALASRPGRSAVLRWYAGHPYLAENSPRLDLSVDPLSNPEEIVSCP